jgi:hypothetical protein
MESQLRRSKRYLDTTNEETRSLSEAVQAISLQFSLSQKRETIQRDARALSRKYKTTKGLHKWVPVNLTEDHISFHYVGPSPESSVELSFHPSSLEGVTCIAHVDKGIFQAYSSRLPSRVRIVSSFLQTRTASLTDEISSKTLSSPHQIGGVLRHFELLMGRHAQTASELVVLHRRYNAILAPSQIARSPNFQVEVDFSSSSRSAKLSVAFELSDAYPFAPLNVCLDTFEGTVDVDELRRLLIKNAKPGFGYLSRTCDVIAAYLR